MRCQLPQGGSLLQRGKPSGSTKAPSPRGLAAKQTGGVCPPGLFVPFSKIVPKGNAFFFLKRGRMINDTEKMSGETGKLLVRNDELLRVYRILLKIGGKLIEFYSRFEYNGE